MTPAKFTPGLHPAPFTFTPNEVGTLGIIRDANGQPILDLLAQQEPLGRLFAAAPGLLAALQEVERDATYNDEDTVESLRVRLDNLSEAARLAIAKAEAVK